MVTTYGRAIPSGSSNSSGMFIVYMHLQYGVAVIVLDYRSLPHLTHRTSPGCRSSLGLVRVTLPSR